MASGELFSRDEALGGLPARRAGTLLFVIESRVGHLADQSRRAADFLASEDASRARDLAFVEAFSAGRQPPVRPTIQLLERYATQWASLVPPAPGTRAALAHLLGQKYVFTKRSVPALRAALSLDDDAVKRAYRRQYGTDLEALYAPRIRAADWLPWAWTALSARVDRLPPFWLTFGLTMAFSFSQAFLALPTGVARFGAGPGVALVVVIGLINMLTMACMAEACARSGDFRYGRAFLGRLVAGYLGPEAAVLFTATTALRTFLVLLAGSVGIGLTLAAFTGLRAEIWMMVLLAVELGYLSRKSATVTVTTMLSLVALNLTCLLFIAILAFRWLDPTNLAHTEMALLGTGTGQPGLFRLVLGVVIMLYIGHVYVIQCAKIVLPRDPGGRSFIGGSVAGTAVLTGIFVLWVLAVNGAVDPDTLASETGTALRPLAMRIGPAIQVLGSVLVILLLGMSCLRTSTVLFNLVQERVPARLSAVLTLSRRRGSLRFHPRGALGDGPHVGVTYLGLAEGHAHLRVDAARDGTVVRDDVVVPESWDAGAILARTPGRPVPSASLRLEILAAQPEQVSLRVVTTMTVEVAGEWSGPSAGLADVADLDDERRGLVTWLLRRGDTTLEEVSAHRGGTVDAARAALDDLVARGMVRPVAGAPGRFRAHLATRTARGVPEEIWTALAPDATPRAAAAARGPAPWALRARGFLVSEAGRFAIGASPLLVVSALGLWMVLTSAGSFAGVLGFGGVIFNTLSAGIFPALLLLASRRKGESVPAVAYRGLGHPAFAVGICVASVVFLLAHGLVIYRDPWSRGSALVVALIATSAIVAMLRRGVFARRCVIELREDARDGGAGLLTITSAGVPLAVDVRLHREAGEEQHATASLPLAAVAGIRHAHVRIPPGLARELKVWAHRVTAEGASEPLAVLVEIEGGAEIARFDLALSAGQVVVPLTHGGAAIARLTLLEPTRPPA